MAGEKTRGGIAYDPAAMDRVERRFWGDTWETVPAPVAVEHGVRRRDFGPVQATVTVDLGEVPMLNFLLGASEPRAVEGGHLDAAVEWARAQGVRPCVPVTPGLPGSAAAEAWLEARGWEDGHAFMKFVRDPHPPRFEEPAGVTVEEVTDGTGSPFGMIAATGFGMPAWGAAFWADLPGRDGWRCYVARIDGEAAACGAIVIDDGVAELGIGATLEHAQRRGCQLALLRRRIADAAEADCRALFVETRERHAGRAGGSYRNILRAGFEEAYRRPNWRPPAGS
jgi:GNAT superfamily N-acetyltransferase